MSKICMGGRIRNAESQIRKSTNCKTFDTSSAYKFPETACKVANRDSLANKALITKSQVDSEGPRALLSYSVMLGTWLALI